MKHSNLRTRLALTALLLVSSTSIAPAANLTALMLFSCDADGNPAGDFVWDTRGSDSDFYKIFVTRGVPGGIPDGLTSPFINGPNWPNVPINVPLEQGTNQFTLFFENNGNWSAFALNLFLDGSLVPAISVKAPVQADSTVPRFSANSAPLTFSLTSYPSANTPAARTTSATSNGRRVELTEYHVTATNVVTLDRVSSHSGTRNGDFDYVGTFTLVVGPRRPSRDIKVDLHVTEVTVCWDTEAGSMYQLEYRTTGAHPTWVPLGDPIAGTGSTTCSVDRIPIGEPQRFYRVSALE